MNASQLGKLVVSALEDIKGKEIEVIDTAKLTPLFERIVVATGDSNRQTRALARNVQDKAREAGIRTISVEGEETGEWILVDLGDVIVHIMQPAIREYYKLEELWRSRTRPVLKASAESGDSGDSPESSESPDSPTFRETSSGA